MRVSHWVIVFTNVGDGKDGKGSSFFVGQLSCTGTVVLCGDTIFLFLFFFYSEMLRSCSLKIPVKGSGGLSLFKDQRAPSVIIITSHSTTEQNVSFRPLFSHFIMEGHQEFISHCGSLYKSVQILQYVPVYSSHNMTNTDCFVVSCVLGCRFSTSLVETESFLLPWRRL